MPAGTSVIARTGRGSSLSVDGGYGRSQITGVEPGTKLRLRGNVGMKDGRPVLINPAYELTSS
jgi:hypothetical protein